MFVVAIQECLICGPLSPECGPCRPASISDLDAPAPPQTMLVWTSMVLFFAVTACPLSHCVQTTPLCKQQKVLFLSVLP